MIEQWQELKETITEMRDNDGTGTQQEVCKFLANYMDILEKQMQDPCEDAISRTEVIKSIDEREDVNGKVDAESVRTDIVLMPSVKPQPKTGQWIAQDIHNCHTDFRCSECGYIHNFLHLFGEPIADYTYCPNCGAKMQEVEE